MTHPPLLTQTLLGTPVGPLRLVASARGLRAIEFLGEVGEVGEVGGQRIVPGTTSSTAPDPHDHPAHDHPAHDHPGLAHLALARAAVLAQLQEAGAAGHPYGLGSRAASTPPPLPPFDLDGHTPFRRRVWDALLRIPHGEVRSYGELALELETGARAVGQAVGANPIPILIPCHRVVAHGGGLGGFSGGLGRKRILLALER
jgi:O-6-methylguanine DNA methyltransferase